MLNFDDWCTIVSSNVGAHSLQVLSSKPGDLDQGIEETAAIVPTHYAAEERLAHLLKRFGKLGAAQFIEGKLPTTKQIRSGDLGEILATEFIAAKTEYSAPIKRLRWKDHRNMAMRGEDVIGIAIDDNGTIKILKTEAKSRVTLSSAVVASARSGLDKDNGLPSAHALSFISTRLFESGYQDLANAIDDAQLVHGIKGHNVKHLLFTLSGNNPMNLLQNSLKAYVGAIAQTSVGIRITGHADFVKSVYDLVIANANND